MKITDDKIRIIKTLKPPHDKKSLQKILGLFQFFRNFVPLFAKSTYHMRNLLKKSNLFSWTPECQLEFENMIAKLITAPILQGISVNKDMYFYTDASYFGIGFSAWQPSDQDPNVLRVVGYGGNALSENQKSWSVMQIELYAIYLCLRQYETYCRHRLIHIFSDNLSLCYLRGMAMGSPREKRLASYIMGFNLHFTH